MAAFFGIIIYEISDNGNRLTGVYTNHGLQNNNTGFFDIDPETADRKAPNNNQVLGGDYACTYLETGSPKQIFRDLFIRQRGNVYEFTWSINGKNTWVGLGMMAGTNRIAVSYTKP